MIVYVPILALTLFAVLQDTSKSEYKPAVYAPALGRALAWDPYGAYALDAEGPLPKADAEILTQVSAGELGRARTPRPQTPRRGGERQRPPWILGQIVRVRQQGKAEYRRNVEGRLERPASPSGLLYRLHVCRVVHDETLLSRSDVDSDLRQKLNKEMALLRDRLRPFAAQNLRITIGITQCKPFWVLANREIVEAYRNANPKGVDVRPLLCQAYNNGIRILSATDENGRRIPNPHAPDEPQPKKALEIARSILKDRPDDPLGHFHAGRSLAKMDLPKSARAEMRAALETGGLPPLYEAAAKRYLETGSEAAFQMKAAY